MKINLAFVALFGCLISNFSSATDISDGINARENGNFQSALEILIALALEDSTEAIHEVSITYSRMNDHATAAIWARAAAERGLAKSQFALGLMYSFGLGVPQDKELEEYWYRKAAEQGNEDAQIALYLSKNVIGPAKTWECVIKEAGAALMSVSESHILLYPKDDEVIIFPRVEPANPTWITGARDDPDLNISMEIALEPRTGKTVRQLLELDTRKVVLSIEGTCTQLSD